jgi:molybdopterin-binding protein
MEVVQTRWLQSFSHLIKEGTMKLSARNQFQGMVTKITEGQAMAEVTVKVGSLEVVAAITEGAVKSMGLKVNDSVTIAVKATDVMVGK